MIKYIIIVGLLIYAAYILYKHLIYVKCPECNSDDIKLIFTDRTDGYSQYYCNKCKHTFLDKIL